MSKDWEKGQGYVDVPKSTPELGVGKDGYQTGGIKIKLLILLKLKRLLLKVQNV